MMRRPASADFLRALRLGKVPDFLATDIAEHPQHVKTIDTTLVNRVRASVARG